MILEDEFPGLGNCLNVIVSPFALVVPPLVVFRYFLWETLIENSRSICLATSRGLPRSVPPSQSLDSFYWAKLADSAHHTWRFLPFHSEPESFFFVALWNCIV